MAVSNFDQLATMGLPVLPGGVPPTTGKIYFVSNRSGDSGSDGNDGLSAERPFSTLAKAYTLMTAGRGDIAIVMPGHAETITTTLTPIAGSATIGLGWGRAKPAFTASGAIDLVTVSAANVCLKNIRLVGATASVTSHILLTGDDAWFEDVDFTHNATPLLSVDVNSTGDRASFIRCRWTGVAAGPDACIDLARNSGNDFYIKDCVAQYSTSSGLDLAFIQGPAADRVGVGGVIDGLTIVGFDAVVVDFNSSVAAVGDGILANINAVSSAGITFANALDVGGYVPTSVYVSDDPAARGKLWPTATPS